MPMLEVMRTLWPLMLKGAASTFADPRGKLSGRRRIGYIRQQNGEFIAAEPRDQVLGPHGVS